MGLIGGIVGGVASAAAGIAGGIAGRKAIKANRKILDEQEKRAQDWYDKEYNADFLQRSDAQSALNSAREILNEQYSNIQGAAAVGGATDEAVAQQKAAANKTVSDVTSSIAERADAYKEQVRANFENQMNSIDQQRMNLNTQQAQNVAQAASAMAKGGSQFGSGIDALLEKK